MLDKCRATIAGKNGEYNYNCPLDERFLEFAGIDAEALKTQLAAGRGDGDILEWIKASAKHHPTDMAIKSWSDFAQNRAPADLESHQYFCELLGKTAPKREDISTWFELLDVDDYLTFGGQP
jgi:hypothetical protein